MLCMEPFSVVKIKFKMQFCNLDDLGLSTLTYSNTSYVSFNLPFRSFWSISVNFRIHFGRFGQLGSRYIGLYCIGLYCINILVYIILVYIVLTSFHFGWFEVISLDFVPYCLISINWDLAILLDLRDFALFRSTGLL